ncbi:MAG TPA: HEAT repeat domain-containing protein [Bryobacteraceae bacterium]|nr:HEAT repeat domain-containing protein [Bryobacteraceae bacterium]
MIRHLTLLGAFGAFLYAQQPPITNADLRQASASSGLESAIAKSVANLKGAGWIGYAVPAIPGDHNSCCWNDNGRGCGLEGQRRVEAVAGAQTPVRLEGPSHVVILLRFEQGTSDKLRVFSPDCPLDAGGLPFYWLSNVKPAESVATLTNWAARQQENTARNQRSESAVHAIAMHAGPEAQAALLKFAEPSQIESTRKSALFWLANFRGKAGYEVVSKVVREDTSDKMREHAIFALTQSKEPEAIPTIIRVAKEDKSPKVRSQALFWLGQKVSKPASEAINEAIERDPDTEVKKKALFALSQLPKDEGVPRLIQIARNHSNPVVRKQAMFWLGQSHDPRAVDFFEQILIK